MLGHHGICPTHEEFARAAELFSQENERLSKEQAVNGADNLSIAPSNPHPTFYYDVPLVLLNHPHQTVPVVVEARNLSSPERSASASSYPSVNQGDEKQLQGDLLSNNMLQNSIYHHSTNGYMGHGVFLEALPPNCEVKIISPPESISLSLFDPATDPRFKVRQLSTGGQAWLFTSSNSKKHWLEQCRRGIEYANLHLASYSAQFSQNRFTSFIPVDSKCPVVETLILETSILGDAIVLGAKRWLSIVYDDIYLCNQALYCKILSSAEQQYLHDFSPLLNRALCSISSSWRPLSFATSTAELTTLFLVCVWVEASRTNTCFDWETTEDLVTWMLKHNVVGENSGGGGVHEVEWALHMATMADMVC